MTDMATPSKKPLSIKEIRKMKDEKRKSEIDKLRIYNISRLQTVNIQIYGKNSKLVPHQQSIRIAPGRHVDLPVSRLIAEQIVNLKKTGFIRTVKVDTTTKITENTETLLSIPTEVKPNKIKAKNTK
jgi:hypothetical protein